MCEALTELKLTCANTAWRQWAEETRAAAQDLLSSMAMANYMGQTYGGVTSLTGVRMITPAS